MKARLSKPKEIAWRVSVMRKRGEYLGTIRAPRDPEAAMAKAREVYGASDPERARRLAVQPMAD
jgi:hypothetical protein